MNTRDIALLIHRDQVRKSNGLPYATHLEETANAVANWGGNQVAIGAAWLHDALEDQELDPCVVAPDIFAVVQELTEDKSKSWEERKRAAIDKIARLSKEATLVKAGDVMSNLRGLLRDGYSNPAIWTKFNAPRDRILWYYRGCVEALDWSALHGMIPEAAIVEMTLLLSYIEKNV